MLLSHNNIIKCVGACGKNPDFIILSEYYQFGSLYEILHGSDEMVFYLFLFFF